MRKFKFAVAQMTSVADTKVNFEVCKGLINQAVEQGARLLALPEGFHFIGTHFTQSVQVAEPITGPTISEYRKIAKSNSIWLSLGGFQEVGPDPEHVFNSHIIINSDGEIIDVYRKLHLFDVSIENGPVLQESRYTSPGSDIKVVESPFGKLGISTCYDLRFPELYCKLVYEMGAQILFVPSAFTVPTGLAHWEILLRARAIEMQSYVIAAAQVGKHSEKRESYGHALVVSPWGEVLVDCGGTSVPGGQVVTFDFDLDYLDAVRAKMPCHIHRRKDVLSKC